MKYVLVTGGVVSGLGKGVTASSVGVVLKACGLRVTSIKIDPYLNTDAGTMSPFEHGEVFVLDDGGEVDLDLGNYERFLDVRLTKNNNITTGKIYQSVLEKERKGDYLGKTVQVVPHITDAIKNWIESVAVIPVDGKEGPADVCVIELGGTVGDIESMPFIEALRQLSFSVGKVVYMMLPFVLLSKANGNSENIFFDLRPDNFCLIHVSLIPVLGVVGEQKTKPTQHSVRELRALGLTPHLLACRSAQPLLENTKEKLSQFCHVPNQNAHHSILKQLNLLSIAAPPNLQAWTKRAETYDNLKNSNMLIWQVRIAMVGKYVGLADSYLSVVKALLHACIACSLKPSIDWIAASDLEDESAKLTPKDHAAAWETLRNAECVLVPGGFGDRGVGGMILAAKYARENNIPYLGICLGMQISVIEFARSVLGLKRANSNEFDSETPNPVVIFMPEGDYFYIPVDQSGGSYGHKVIIPPFGAAFCPATCRQLVDLRYRNAEYVDERHRHRYEVNPEAIGVLEEAGLKFVGKDETGKRMEILELYSLSVVCHVTKLDLKFFCFLRYPQILELPSHPFYVGVQFHPEFKSRPGRPSALFLGLILAATKQLEAYLNTHQNGC
ncbi:CTP synthase [Citrus sinensis]|uniref:CTP synthase n=1 Tax=Citrus sinensis TaxID=2711 RepID=A0ACB8L411_CITSI|nr:CTP synthase [Citrus sinensis]